MILNELEVLLVESLRIGAFRVLPRLVHGGEYLAGARPGVQSLRTFSREQPENEIGAVRRQFEERLVHQVQLQVAAADVDDERHPRLERRDIGEVLLGTHSEVDALGLRRAEELGDHRLEEELVRQQVVGSELAVRLGELHDHVPELGVRERIRKGQHPRADSVGRHPGEGQRDNRGTQQQERTASQHKSPNRDSDSRQSAVVRR